MVSSAVCWSGCFSLRGGEGGEDVGLGVRGNRGVEAGVVDQKGSESRLEMEAVCLADPWASRASHRGDENRSMSTRCDGMAGLGPGQTVRKNLALGGLWGGGFGQSRRLGAGQAHVDISGADSCGS